MKKNTVIAILAITLTYYLTYIIYFMLIARIGG